MIKGEVLVHIRYASQIGNDMVVIIKLTHNKGGTIP
jgi:hypothetical protein